MRGDLAALSGELDIGGVRRALIAEDDRYATHAFAADEADLGFGAFLFGDNGQNTGARKDDAFDRPVWTFEGVAQLHVHRDQMRLEQAEVGSRKQLKKLIAFGKSESWCHA